MFYVARKQFTDVTWRVLMVIALFNDFVKMTVEVRQIVEDAGMTTMILSTTYDFVNIIISISSKTIKTEISRTWQTSLSARLVPTVLMRLLVLLPPYLGAISISLVKRGVPNFTMK